MQEGVSGLNMQLWRNLLRILNSLPTSPRAIAHLVLTLTQTSHKHFPPWLDCTMESRCHLMNMRFEGKRERERRQKIDRMHQNFNTTAWQTSWSFYCHLNQFLAKRPLRDTCLFSPSTLCSLYSPIPWQVMYHLVTEINEDIKLSASTAWTLQSGFRCVCVCGPASATAIWLGISGRAGEARNDPGLMRMHAVSAAESRANLFIKSSLAPCNIWCHALLLPGSTITKHGSTITKHGSTITKHSSTITKHESTQKHANVVCSHLPALFVLGLYLCACMCPSCSNGILNIIQTFHNKAFMLIAINTGLNKHNFGYGRVQFWGM